MGKRFLEKTDKKMGFEIDKMMNVTNNKRGKNEYATISGATKAYSYAACSWR